MGQTLKEGGRELRLKVLQAVKERIAFYGDQAELDQLEWKGKDLDVLTADLVRFGDRWDHCLGEYFFQPAAGSHEGGQYFCAVISLYGDIAVKRVPELAFAVSITNFYLETGCFALNESTDLLAYRNTRTFPGDTPEEILKRDCVFVMEETYEIAARYCTPLMALAEGSMTLTEYLERVKT